MFSTSSPRTLSTTLVMALSVMCASAALAAGQEKAPKPHGKAESHDPSTACMKSVKAALPNPASFKWVGGNARKVADDAYSVVADVEYLASDGAVRKAKVQCDVQRAPGNQYVVSKLRLP